jgi:outer membrane translocation and assembly module TamA
MKSSLAWLLLALAPLACFAQTDASDDTLIVEGLQCRGNSLTACEFITGHIYLTPGDRLDEHELQNAKLRLTTLRNFDSVDIRLEKGSAQGLVTVVIEVAEANPLAMEWLLGTSARLYGLNQVLAGRLAHQNLFGAGKIADLSAVGVAPIDDPERRALRLTARYADPHLFGSRKYFAVGSLTYRDESTEDIYGSFATVDMFRLGATVGRRLWDFSYLTLGYGYRAELDVRTGSWQSDGSFELDEADDRHAIDVIYGWNSEDDFFFPTRGSTFHIGLGLNFGTHEPEGEFHFQFRKTWQTAAGSLWTLKIGGDPSPEYRTSFGENQALSFSYSRPFAYTDVRRGRWYIEPGYGGAGRKPDGQGIYEIGIKVGVRLETRTLGIVDLYLIATTDPDGRGPTP